MNNSGMRRLPASIKVLLLLLIIAASATQQWWGDFVGPVPRVARVLISFTTVVLIINLAILALVELYRRRKKMKQHQADNVTVGLQNLYYLILAGLVILTIAALWNIDPIELFTSLSIVAAAIAIISKDFISEIISGMIITFSKEVAIGDYIRIGDQRGKVTDITLTKIALLNDDDDVIYLPNNKVYTSEIINYTRKEIRKVSIDFELNILAVKTVEELEADLIDAISDYEAHIVPDSYNLKIVEIRKDSLDLKFQYVLRQINRELEREIRRKTVRRVVNYVKQNLPGAKVADPIPYPKMSVEDK